MNMMVSRRALLGGLALGGSAALLRAPPSRGRKAGHSFILRPTPS